MLPCTSTLSCSVSSSAASAAFICTREVNSTSAPRCT